MGYRPDPDPDALRASFFASLPRYEYLGPLGQGGAGYVFKAIDRELNAVIAIKVMGRTAGEEQDKVLLRFKGEVIMNRRISHPNICRLYDYGVTGGLPYLTMEFVDGRHLGTIMEEGPVPSKTALHVLKQLARAVAAAHAAGIIHRDLKPANVMVRSSGGISVLDFGLAHDTTRTDPRITQVGTAVGTPHYMSPEQVQGRLVDERSDIYAIGAIAFELLSGRRMFSGNSFLSIAKKHLETPVSRDMLEERGVPRELAATVLRCLEKKPEDRFPSAAAVAGSFEALERLHSPRKSAISAEAAAAARVKTAIHRRSAILPSAAPGRRPVVLVVDDEEQVRNLVCASLRSGGFEAVPSASGEDALTLLETRTVDLILIDELMPGVDGFDTVRVLKSRPEQARIPVLFMSASPKKNQMLFAGQTGVVDFLAKPLDLKSMLKKVSAILAKPV